MLVKHSTEWIIIHLTKINKLACLKNRWPHLSIIFEDIKYTDRIYSSFSFKWHSILCLSFKEVNVSVLRSAEQFFFSKTLAKELKRWTKRFLQNILRNRQPKWWSWRSIYQNTIKIGPLTTQMKTSRTRATFDLLLKLNTSWIEFEASDLLLVLIHVLNKVCCTTLQWNPFDASVIYF